MLGEPRRKAVGKYLSGGIWCTGWQPCQEKMLLNVQRLHYIIFHLDNRLWMNWEFCYDGVFFFPTDKTSTLTSRACCFFRCPPRLRRDASSDLTPLSSVSAFKAEKVQIAVGKWSRFLRCDNSSSASDRVRLRRRNETVGLRIGSWFGLKWLCC